jgi:hypothetical protein
LNLRSRLRKPVLSPLSYRDLVDLVDMGVDNLRLTRCSALNYRPMLLAVCRPPHLIGVPIVRCREHPHDLEGELPLTRQPELNWPLRHVRRENYDISTLRLRGGCSSSELTALKTWARQGCLRVCFAAVRQLSPKEHSRRTRTGCQVNLSLLANSLVRGFGVRALADAPGAASTPGEAGVTYAFNRRQWQSGPRGSASM